jgi:3D (Asp-Asp-Asp) domain-containing protein
MDLLTNKLGYITIIAVMAISLLAVLDYENKIENLEEEIELNIQDYEINLDSLTQQINYLELTLDSLPIGNPLDTLLIMDTFRHRRHPIFGSWHLHSGIDLIDTYKDTVYATASGISTMATWNAGYGKCVTLKHAHGYGSKYAHLDKIFVKKGDNVTKGQPIGTMGSTGNVTGQHLHYEVLFEGNAVDPMPYIRMQPMLVKATMYHPVEEQCDSDPLITADGSIICPISVSDWNWIAVSQDLLKKNGGVFDYGDQVYIEGTHKDGVYTIRDCMHKRKKNQIDFLESIGTNQYKYDDIKIYNLENFSS